MKLVGKFTSIMFLYSCFSKLSKKEHKVKLACWHRIMWTNELLQMYTKQCFMQEWKNGMWVEYGTFTYAYNSWFLGISFRSSVTRHSKIGYIHGNNLYREVLRSRIQDSIILCSGSFLCTRQQVLTYIPCDTNWAADPETGWEGKRLRNMKSLWFIYLSVSLESGTWN